MATLATKYDEQTIELQQLRWNEDLTGAQRAAIASELEKQRCIPEYQYVDPTTLFVDETYQRPLSVERVWEIATNFTWMLFDPLWVGRRKDDRLYVVDGRHRLAAALILGRDRIDTIPAQIRRTAGVEEEAKIFIDLQEKRRIITSAQRFAAKLIYNDPTAVALQRLLSKHRFIVPSEAFGGNGTTNKQNEVTAIGTLERIFMAGGKQRVDAVLQVIREAWDGVPPTCSGWMLRAVNRLIEREPNKQPATLARRLQEKDPWGLIERGMRFAHSNGIPTSDAMSDVLLKVVNE